MREPPKSFVDFSDQEWADIRNVVKHLGVDADTLSVRSVAGKQWPLRRALSDAVRFSSAVSKGLEDLPTPHQVAKHLETKRKEILAFVRSFGSPLVDYGYPGLTKHFIGWDEYLTRTRSPFSCEQRQKINHQLLQVLGGYDKALEAEAQRFEAKRLAAVGNKNAAKPTVDRNQYLRFVLITWVRIGGDKAPSKLTKAFLLACTRPAFPSTNEKIVQNWIERYGQRLASDMLPT
jgi:hypothetical protein